MAKTTITNVTAEDLKNFIGGDLRIVFHLKSGRYVSIPGQIEVSLETGFWFHSDHLDTGIYFFPEDVAKIISEDEMGRAFIHLQ